jgi:ferrous iron transport protein B
MIAAPENAVPSTEPATTCVVLTGNPNCGKTTLFNGLTGLRAKVGNYAGVTVERKEGRLLGSPRDKTITVLDLPGTYSLSPQSLDEQISRDVLFRRLADVPAPSLVVVVIDASNLERNLYYATQVIELGYPTALALNMIDVAAQNGLEIDSAQLATILGVPVFAMVASTGEGLPALRQFILQSTPAQSNGQALFCDLSPVFVSEVDNLGRQLEGKSKAPPKALARALLLIADERSTTVGSDKQDGPLRDAIEGARRRIEASGADWRTEAIESRYGQVARICRHVVRSNFTYQETFSDKLDRVLTHKLLGMLIFVAIMALMFQSIFTFARIPMEAIQAGVDAIGNRVSQLIPPGELNSLLVKGVIAGVGAVVVFLPQILLLFLFISLLEDTGYMARAAFLMDRLMSKVGLHGKSFIPMLSSFACAIPGIMATRTIESPKDRLVTILVAPLMSCSARLPVYTLLIAACIPSWHVLWILNLQGLTMLAMYLLGIVVALLMAWLFKKTLLKSETPLLIMELPPYKKPVTGVVLRQMWDRSKIFLRRAGTVILGISILLWFLATYPHSAAVEQHFAQERAKLETSASPGMIPAGVSEQSAKLETLRNQEEGARLRNSFAGRIGRAMEPLIVPLGFDWKIGIGLVASFAAREVFVSTMSTVYNVGEYEKSAESTRSLAQTLRAQVRPNGQSLYTPLIGITLMVFYVFALQCVSTVAIVRRETNSWKWPLFQWAYMAGLAWLFAFVTYHGGKLLGFQ